MSPVDDDFIKFIDEDEDCTVDLESSSSNNNFWNVLIVDDDESVHSITNLLFRDLVFESKKIKTFHAYSAEESKKLLSEISDIGLIFLDVVMETQTAGLDLVRHIRNQINNNIVRIILRTGQPGSAPEKSVIIDYDINDYKLKTELTADKLYVITIAALRSYRDLMTLEQNRRSLEKIVNASTFFLKHTSVNEFQDVIMEQLVAMARNESQPYVQQISGFISTEVNNSFLVDSHTPDIVSIDQANTNSFLKPHEIEFVNSAIGNPNAPFCHENYLTYYFKSNLGYNKLLFLEKRTNFSNIEKEMYSIFLNNVCVALDNIKLGKEIDSAQREMIFMLSEVAELRSKETSFHVKRVAEYSNLIGIKLKINSSDCELLKMASPLHDIGKIAVPDEILNKPGKLTNDEFNIMRAHTVIGYEMLINSKTPLMSTAANISLSHHEKYDGTGYPNGLRGEEIDLFSRIVAVADVFDALGSKRPYKDSWPLEKIIEYFREQNGKHFDPKIVSILLDNINDFITIRDNFKDIY